MIRFRGMAGILLGLLLLTGCGSDSSNASVPPSEGDMSAAAVTIVPYDPAYEAEAVSKPGVQRPAVTVVPYDPAYDPASVPPDEIYDRPECVLVTQETDLARIGALLYQQMHTPYLASDQPAESRLISFAITDALTTAIRLDAAEEPCEWVVRILYDMQTALPYEQSIWKPSNGEMLDVGCYRDCGTFIWIRKTAADTYQLIRSGTGGVLFNTP